MFNLTDVSPEVVENVADAAKKTEIGMGEAGIVALQGMLVVFAVLIILMVVLYIMKLFSKSEPKQTVAAPVAQAPAASAQTVTTDETVAVICSSVAAMSGDDPTKRLRVVSIQEQATGKLVWKK